MAISSNNIDSMLREAKSNLQERFTSKDGWTVSLFNVEPDGPGRLRLAHEGTIGSAAGTMTGRVATRAACLHASIVADVASVSVLERERGMAQEESLPRLSHPSSLPFTSIFAVPVFNPAVFDPSPMLRPIAGVATFAGSESAPRLLENTQLRSYVEKLATMFVSQLIYESGQSPPFETSSNQFPVRWQGWMNEDAAYPPITQGGLAWLEFERGHFATLEEVREFRRIQRLLVSSEKYLHELHQRNALLGESSNDSIDMEGVGFSEDDF